MANDIGPRIGVQGEAEFRRQIAECNTSLKTLGTEMNKVTSAFIGNENSTKALKAANKELEKQFEAQAEKANVLKNRMEELDKQGVDPTSAAYQKLAQELNKTEADMNKTSAAIDANKEKMTSFGDVISKVAESVGTVLVSGLNLAVEGAKKFAGAMLDAAAAADDLQTLATKTGISTEELQKFQYAAGTIDVSVDTLAGSMSKLTKQMANAAGGSKSAQEAFSKLGVSVTNSDGSFRDRNEVFNETIKALGEITDETERDAAAMAIFGRSAQELNPLILGGAEALEQLGQHAEEAGLIMSEQDVEALATLNDRFDVLQQTISMAGSNFLAQFAGPFTEGINTVIGYVEKLVSAFSSGGFSGLGDAVGSIMSDIATKVATYLPKVTEFAMSVVESLATGLLENLPVIVQSGIEVITTLVNSLADMLPELIPVAVEAILTLVSALTDPANIGNLVDAAIAIIIGLANGLIAALPALLKQAPVIISNLVTALISNVGKLLEAALQIVVSIGQGIIDNLGTIFDAAGEIIMTIVDGVVSLATTVWDIGRNIVEGIWQGIKNAGDWLWQQISGFFGDLIDGICEFLGIHSPSTVFENLIGKNMALGIGEGFTNAMDGVERDMMSSIPVPTVDATVNGGAVAMGGLGGGVVEEITIPVMVGEAELARVLYRHIVGEGQRIGPAMVM